MEKKKTKKKQEKKKKKKKNRAEEERRSGRERKRAKNRRRRTRKYEEKGEGRNTPRRGLTYVRASTVKYRERGDQAKRCSARDRARSNLLRFVVIYGDAALPLAPPRSLPTNLVDPFAPTTLPVPRFFADRRHSSVASKSQEFPKEPTRLRYERVHSNRKSE